MAHYETVGMSPLHENFSTDNSETESDSENDSEDEYFNEVPAIKGADIVFQTYMEVTPGQLFTYHWEGHGFKVHIPAGAISSESGPVTLSIQASLSGDYQLPDDRVLVSGVYWLALQPPVKFNEKATITIHHCAAGSAISFVTAKCTQEKLPYTFKPLSGGCFSDPGFGTIEVDHFSAFAAVAKESFYAFCTFYVPQQINVYDAHITVTPNSEPHLKVLKKEYGKKEGIDEGDTIIAQIEKKEISLIIGTRKRKSRKTKNWERSSKNNDWELSSIKPTTLLKAVLDNYQRGRAIPYFAIRLKWRGSSAKSQLLSQRIDFTGTKMPTFITISRPSKSGLTSDNVQSPVGSPMPVAKRARVSSDDTLTPSQVVNTEEGKIYGGVPTLPSLLTLKIHNQVCANSLSFGIVLLDDTMGTRIDAIQKEGSPEEVVVKILREWVQGKGLPVTWESLLKSVNVSGPKTLEDKIQSRMKLYKQKTE